MHNSERTILVTGATGRQGTAVVKALLASGMTPKALVRSTSRPGAMRLKKLGVELVNGDLNDTASLKTAIDGCYGVFSLQNPWEWGDEVEIQQGKNVADAAKAADVKHFVYASVGAADTDTGIGHFQTKGIIEQYIKQLGLPATMIRPAAFMENFYILDVHKGILGGKYMDGIAGNKPVQLVCQEDIGAFAALVFSDPNRFIGQAITIAGDELTNVQIAERFSQVMGKKVKFWKMPGVMVRLLIGKDYHQVIQWANRSSGFGANILALKRDYPDVAWTTVEDWLIKEGWDRWNKRGKF